MQEIRILFAPAAGNGHRISLTDGAGQPLGVAVPFTPFLTDADYDNLRGYLEEYMELPDGGAVVRAERIEADLARWGHQLHDAIFSAPEKRDALTLLLAAPEPRELTIATDRSELLRLPWELLTDSAGRRTARPRVECLVPARSQGQVPARRLLDQPR